MIDRLRTLQANKGQFTNSGELSNSLKTNQDLRKEVEFLSKNILRRSVQGCSNCYMDAYIELISIKIENIIHNMECQFTLLPGAVLRDVNGDMKYLCSQFNITDELALYHLKTNPKCADLFEELPEDWEEQVEEFELSDKQQAAVSEQEQTTASELEQAKQKITELENSNEINAGFILEKDNEIATLKEKVEKLEAKVLEKDNEIARLTSFSNGFTGEVYQDDEEIDLNTLDRIALLDLIKTEEYNIEVTDEMSDDALRDAIVVECEKQDSETLSDSDKELEDAIVVEIADKLKAGATKTALRKEYQDTKVGEKNITQRYMTSLLAKADELNK